MKTVMILLMTVLVMTGAVHAEEFLLTSPQVKDGGSMAEEQVFAGFGCNGGNKSPALVWRSAPAGTKSFAVTVYDPDAPTGSGWWHWVIFNIPSTAAGLAKDAGNPSSGKAPNGSIQSRTDFGKPGYGGACPPVGNSPHRYIYTVFALKTDMIPLDSDASAAMVGFFLNADKLASASLTAYYGR
ncbi:YbhB/YbcL family Raf kinase inhibitor-like protein [Geomonas sp. Red875]|uniref:YbhB/YbcL family Raf kinase inhibitor-like protein n=1 Tax=Geomesophilobacter sediminis TaxID=2798584 RepID=A0A8J7LYU9_9BACT|nr:YbhB/YbcL family Raf kinase inhibitor-like protein [Geomesophilobacter sediminis]